MNVNGQAIYCHPSRLSLSSTEWSGNRKDRQVTANETKKISIPFSISLPHLVRCHQQHESGNQR